MILRVDFELGAPVALDFPIHFDMLLLREYAIEMGYSDEDYDPNNQLEMPFVDKYNDVYLASVGFLVAREGLEYWHKRFDLDNVDVVDFREKQEKVRIGSGQFKSYKMPLRTFTADKIVFFVKGDEEKIEKYSKRVTGIGKKCAYGFGFVKNVTLTEIYEPLYVFSVKQFTRHIPTEYASYFFRYSPNILNVTFGHVPYKPPYWYRPNFTRCVCPVKWVFETPEQFQEWLGIPY